MFDFDGDGHTDTTEELTGLMMFNDLTKEDSEDNSNLDYEDIFDF